ncbi:MAG: hypothetical protein ACFBSC_14145 [Microcoleaceae cyanobacterium]
MKIGQLVGSLALLLGLVIFPGPALAHSVATDYQLVSDFLEIQSTFSSGESFEDAPVVVYSPNDLTRPWLEGTTDASGKFIFEPDPSISGEWSVEIGEGSHWDKLRVPVGDQGIEVEAISYQPEPIAHNHRRFSEQFIVVGLALGGGISTRFLRQFFRKIG